MSDPRNEVLIAYAFVYNRLVGDTAIGASFTARGLTAADHVWEYRAPEGTGNPVIAFQRIGGGDVNTVAGYRIYSVVRTLIRVYDYGEDWSHEDIAHRLDALFSEGDNVPVTDPAGLILFTRRVEPWDQPEDIGGVQYRGIGGVFDIAAQAT